MGESKGKPLQEKDELFFSREFTQDQTVQSLLPSAIKASLSHMATDTRNSQFNSFSEFISFTTFLSQNQSQNGLGWEGP